MYNVLIVVIFLLQDTKYRTEYTIQLICIRQFIDRKKKWIVLRTDGFLGVKVTNNKLYVEDFPCKVQLDYALIRFVSILAKFNWHLHCRGSKRAPVKAKIRT
jgi:hypothetical protein